MLLLGLGLWLRFHALEWMEYSGDEYVYVRDAIAAAHGEWHPIGPTSSIGLPLPNFILYLLALPALLSPDPLTLVRFVGCLNVLGLVAMAFLLRALLAGRSGGLAGVLIAVAFLASSAQLVLYSRKIWNPDLLFPFFALLLCMLALLRAGRAGRAGPLWAAAIALCAFWTGFHPSTLFLLPALLLWAVWFVRPWRPGWIACGLALAICMHTPYLLRLWESNADDVLLVATMRERAPVHSITRLDALLAHAWQLLVHSGAGALGLTRPWGLLAQAWMLWMGLSLVVALALSPAWIRKRNELPLPEALAALAAWSCAALVLALGWGRYSCEPHYYATVQPLPALLGMWLLWRCSARIAAVLLLSVGAVHAALLLGFLGELREGNADPRVPYSSPYALSRSEWDALLAEELEQILAGHPAAAEARELARASFERSGATAMRWDASMGLGALEVWGQPRLAVDGEWLRLEGGSLVDMLLLPDCSLPDGQRGVLRLELSVPKPLLLTILFPDSATGRFGHQRKVDLRLSAQANTAWVLLPEQFQGGRLMLRLPASRYRLRTAELRAVPKESFFPASGPAPPAQPSPWREGVR